MVMEQFPNNYYRRVSALSITVLLHTKNVASISKITWEQTDRQTDTHTDGRTDTQNDYCNPLSTPGLIIIIIIILLRMITYGHHLITAIL